MSDPQEAKFQVRLTRSERFQLKILAAQRMTTMEELVLSLIRRELFNTAVEVPK